MSQLAGIQDIRLAYRKLLPLREENFSREDYQTDTSFLSVAIGESPSEKGTVALEELL